MTDTSRSRPVTSDPGEVRPNSHHTQLQTLYHLRAEDLDPDPRCARWQQRRWAGEQKPRFHASSALGKTPSLRGPPVSCSGIWGLSKDHQWSSSFLQTHANMAKHEHGVPVWEVGGLAHLASPGSHGETEAPQGTQWAPQRSVDKSSESFPCQPSYNRKVSPQWRGSPPSPSSWSEARGSGLSLKGEGGQAAQARVWAGGGAG